MARRRNRWTLPPWTCTKQVSAQELGQAWPWGLKFAGIDKLHVETKGAGVKIGIIDTGIDTTHPDLAGNILSARDFSRSAFGVEDRVGHGTHTAGTMVAIDNGVGSIGLMPEGKLIVAKGLGDDGSGPMDVIASCIIYCVDEGADVINLSVGSPDPDDDVLHALQYASEHGVLVSSAAGNDGIALDRFGKQLNTVDYPGKWTNLCSCVGAHDEQGKIADFSSRGPEVDFLAPGVKVLSCFLAGRYSYMNGTSMATPFVAGTIGLMIAYRRKHNLPAIKNQVELETELFKTAIKIGNGGPAFGSGHGLLNPKGLFDDMATAPKPAPAPTKVERYPFPFLRRWMPGYTWELVGTPDGTKAKEAA